MVTKTFKSSLKVFKFGEPSSFTLFIFAEPRFLCSNFGIIKSLLNQKIVIMWYK